MATLAFKSTTRRTPIGANSSPSTEDSPDSSSSKAQRRSTSLSRFSRSFALETESGVIPTPRRKFVNTVRGSEFPEISLDDLAIEFFYNSSELEDESRKAADDISGNRTQKLVVDQRTGVAVIYTRTKRDDEHRRKPKKL
ncbi:hypothetical protein E3N88_13747 [Mikania micrantha]|uniref:Uncharacterized protein n=1 Tax=Mikania micrantha TaxID=192012 RepID=A0A5N6P0N9_9ASTR|nr:hypothetical protein E3N88_13747 [Mikania micrantha]